MDETITPRIAEVHRKTGETDVRLSLTLDGSGCCEANSGVPFLDHMLTLLAHHGLFDMELTCEGDLQVDYHHTVEDIGLALGQAVRQAVGDKAGLCRYGFYLLPMDECLARVALDLSNRPVFVYQVELASLMIRDFNVLLVREFFRAFANEAGANLHMKLEYGDEPHHAAEALFKAFGRALDQAVTIDPRRQGSTPSTKGKL